jgi:hypothetical protein
VENVIETHLAQMKSSFAKSTLLILGVEHVSNITTSKMKEDPAKG